MNMDTAAIIGSLSTRINFKKEVMMPGICSPSVYFEVRTLDINRKYHSELVKSVYHLMNTIPDELNRVILEAKRYYIGTMIESTAGFLMQATDPDEYLYLIPTGILVTDSYEDRRAIEIDVDSAYDAVPYYCMMGINVDGNALKSHTAEWIAQMIISSIRYKLSGIQSSEIFTYERGSKVMSTAAGPVATRIRFDEHDLLSKIKFDELRGLFPEESFFEIMTESSREAEFRVPSGIQPEQTSTVSYSVVNVNSRIKTLTLLGAMAHAEAGCRCLSVLNMIKLAMEQMRDSTEVSTTIKSYFSIARNALQYLGTKMVQIVDVPNVRFKEPNKSFASGLSAYMSKKSILLLLVPMTNLCVTNTNFTLGMYATLLDFVRCTSYNSELTAIVMHALSSWILKILPLECIFGLENNTMSTLYEPGFARGVFGLSAYSPEAAAYVAERYYSSGGNVSFAVELPTVQSWQRLHGRDTGGKIEPRGNLGSGESFGRYWSF